MGAFPNGRERGGALWAIDNRRSIRKFQDTPLPMACVLEILQCALKAPSSKNRQPWKFVVVEGRAKEEMLRAFERGLSREEASPLLPDSNIHLPAAKHTLKILRQAPVVIFVVNPLGKPLGASLTAEERVYEICNTQSVAAAIENMLLAATEMGVGSPCGFATFTLPMRNCARGCVPKENFSPRWPWAIRTKPPRRGRAGA